jgi:hypothetical protein
VNLRDRAIREHADDAVARIRSLIAERRTIASRILRDECQLKRFESKVAKSKARHAEIQDELNRLEGNDERSARTTHS